MRKKIAKISTLIALSAVMVIGLSAWHASHTQAAFVANDLMDDNVMNNVNSMTAAQIDSFLNANFPNSCISSNHGFSANDPVGYNPTNGFIFGAPVSAGRVIYDAAQAYGLNPQVLVATLEKEENLVTGNSGCSAWRYASAVGFSCTDSGTNSHNYTYTNGSDPGTLPTPLYYINGSPQTSVSSSCVSSPLDAGFSEQLIWASWLLEKGLQRSEGNVNWAVIKPNWDNSDESDCYGGPMTQGNLKRCRSDSQTTFYDGYITIDGQSVHMDTGATASLYWYTPHFSGNINFVNLFEGWFGPTKGSLVQAYGDKTVYLLSGAVAYPIYDVNVLNDLSALGPVRQTSAAEINNYATGSVAGHIWRSSSGTIYLIDANIKLAFPDCDMVADYGYSCTGSPLSLTDAQLAMFQNGPPVTHLLKAVSSPTVYYISGDTKRAIPAWSDVQAFGIPIMNTLTDSFVDQLPTSGYNAYGPGSLVKTLNSPRVYAVKDINNVFPLNDFLYSNELGLGTSVRTIASNYSIDNNSLMTMVQCNGSFYVGTKGTTYLISSSIMTAYGFQASQFMDVGSACLNLPISSQPLGQFIRLNNGAIFYVSNGQKQFITNYSAYVAHGGNSSNTINVSDYFANMIADGGNINT